LEGQVRYRILALVEKLTEEEWAVYELLRHPAWCGEFVRNLEKDEDEGEAWVHTDYQYEFLMDYSSQVSLRAGRGVGKTQVLVTKLMWHAMNKFFDEALFVVPNRSHLDPVFLQLQRQFRLNPLLRWWINRFSVNAQQFIIKFVNGFTLICRIAGTTGTGVNVVGLHVPIIFLDESAYFPWNVWLEMQPVINDWELGYQILVSGVPDGRREKSVCYHCDNSPDYSKHRISAYRNPRFTEDAEKRAIDQYGGKDSQDFIRQVLGEHGTPTYAVFDREMLRLEDYDVPVIRLYGEQLKRDSQLPYRVILNLPNAPKYTSDLILGIDLGYCYSEDTEVLTSRGWLKHQETNENDIIACFDTNTNEIIWDKPLFLRELDYDGKMIEVSGKSTNFMVSPEHSVWACKTKGYVPQDYEEMQAVDLLKLANDRFRVKIAPNRRNTIGKSTFTVPYYYSNRKDRVQKSTDVPMSVWVQFLAWFVSEGSATANHQWEVNLTQSKNRYADEIDKVLKQLPYTVTRQEYINQWGKEQVKWTITCKELCLWLRDNCGIHSKNKKIPEFIFNCSTEDQELFLRTLLLGDGSRINCERSPQYWTQSKTLIDQFQRLALILGYSSTVGFHKSSGGMYSASVMKRKENELSKKKNIKLVHYSGKIYCFKTRTGFYITRRNGRVAIQGNTQPTAINALYRLQDSHVWYFLFRLELFQINYDEQEKIINRLDTKYNPSFLGMDVGSGGQGKSLYHNFVHSDTYRDKDFVKRMLPVEFGGTVVVGFDEGGNEMKERIKQFSASKLQQMANNHDIAFSKRDQDLLTELERITYYRTATGNPVYKAVTPLGSDRGDDHNFAALLTFVMVLFEKYDSLEFRPSKPKLLRSRWLL